MFSNFNNIEYVIICERLKLIKVKNINNIMQRILKYMQENFYKAREIILKQINK